MMLVSITTSAGGEEADFHGLPDGVLLVERALKLRDADDADNRQRRDPEHALADRFGKADAGDGPGARKAEPPKVIRAADHEQAEDDDSAGDDPAPVVGEPADGCQRRAM